MTGDDLAAAVGFALYLVPPGRLAEAAGWVRGVLKELESPA